MRLYETAVRQRLYPPPRAFSMSKRLTPAGISLLYAAFSALWIIASATLLTFTVSDHDLQSSIEIAKGMLFVTITSGLLYLLLKGQQEQATPVGAKLALAPSLVRLILLFTALALIAPVIGVAVLQLYGPHVEREAYANLQAISRLKSSQIENWLGERNGNGVVMAAKGFAEQVERFKRHKDASLQEAITSRLSALKDTYGYTGVMLQDSNGRLMLMLGDQDDMTPDLQEKMRQALATKTVQRGNLYRDETGNVHLDWVAPIIVADKQGKRAVATVVLRITAQHFLYPLIQTWPTASPSAETLLVRREGESAVFLNDLRHRKSTALTLRLPLSKADLPAAIAIHANKAGTTPGQDHRGNAVLAAYRPVAGTDWFIVAKVDRNEVMAPLQAQVFWVSFIAFAAVIALSTTILLLWRQQRRIQRIEAEQKISAVDASLQQSMKRTQILVNSALDAVVSMDQEGKVIDWNPQAEVIFGYSSEQAMGREVADLIVPPAHREAHRQGMARFVATGTPTIMGKRIEIQGMRSDGSEFPVELTLLALIQNEEQFFSAYIRDITERKKSEEAIHNLAFYDPLTKLPNRRLMLDRLKQTLLSSTRNKRFGALLFIDLDDFKTLNDTKGHSVGDQLLIEVTTRLQAVVHVDATVARIGGDEFAVLLDALSESSELAAVRVKAVADRVLVDISMPLNLQGHDYHCTASIGITMFCDQDVSVDELLKQADMAMHQAKQDGRNTICFFDPAAQTALETRVLLESWMRSALNDQYQLYYQAQIDRNGKATGAEALIRWIHPEQGIISPAAFIPLAEETGLILTIGAWVLETACAQLKAWEHDTKARHLNLAVNVSARQFNQPDFAEKVLAVIDRTGINPDRLKLELTESMLVNDVDDIIIKMNVLKAKGVKFSLDDFGTGFSSLAYLKKLPLNQLKIDQSFVLNALTDPSDVAIIRTVIALGQSMGMDIIAEGVETEAQRNLLASLGCYHYQGYLFSKPVPLDEFERLLLKG